MEKAIRFTVHILFACLMAAAFGALHNQVSYTVGLEYFHAFKFIQFAIEDGLQNRLGAAIVGVYASWWMGIIIGLPVGIIVLFAPRASLSTSYFIRSCLRVILITAATAMIALMVGFETIHADALPIWMSQHESVNPVGFARAGLMHNYSYFGAVIGLAYASIWSIRHTIKARRRHLFSALS